MKVSRYWKPKEVARHFRIDRATVYRRIQAGDIPAVKIGGQYRIPEREGLLAGRRVAIGANGGGQKCSSSASFDNCR